MPHHNMLELLVLLHTFHSFRLFIYYAVYDNSMINEWGGKKVYHEKVYRPIGSPYIWLASNPPRMAPYERTWQGLLHRYCNIYREKSGCPAFRRSPHRLQAIAHLPEVHCWTAVNNGARSCLPQHRLLFIHNIGKHALVGREWRKNSPTACLLTL